MKRMLLGAAVLTAVLIGTIVIHAQNQTAEKSAWKPPKVELGARIVLDSAVYDMKKWKTATKLDAPHWFATYPSEGWGINWDAEAKPFDLIVVHHSATTSTVTAEQLSISTKERLYVPRYRSEDRDPYVKGLPVHSGHVVNGKETFIPYHHLIYPGGKITTELAALHGGKGAWHILHVGWHAGNWNVNCRSVALCLIGDFTKEEPSTKQIASTVKLVTYYRTYNPKAAVKPHSHFRPTECPGKAWPAIEKALQK